MSTSSASGNWYYTDQQLSLLQDIHKNGWKPDRNTGTKYGCGVYLSRGWWHADAAGALRCQLNVTDIEIVSEFPEIPGFEQHGAGNTQYHLARYLVHEGVVSGRPSASRGSTSDNIAIRDFFLGQGQKVVMFTEHDHDVCVVFDPSCIRIIELVEPPSITSDSESDLDDD